MINEQTIKIRMLMMRKGITGSKIANRIGVTRAVVNETIRFKYPSDTPARRRARKMLAEVLEESYTSLWNEPEPSEEAA